jgi:putative tryptophan/tyrosine transport system substrate-binding protein
LGDPEFTRHRTQITALTQKNRLPGMYVFREFVEAGGLMSYGVSLSDLWRRAASYVDKILQSATPAELPVEQPTKFELVIHLKTAQALGMTLPPSVLLLADEVIQ